MYVIKGERKTQTQVQNLGSTTMISLQKVLGGKKIAGLTNQHLTGYKAFYEMEPIASTAQVSKNLRLDKPGAKGKTKYYSSAKITLAI